MRKLVGMASAVMLLASSALASAQPSEEDTAAARALFDEGRRLAGAQAWSDAADRFRRALSLRPSAAIRYNLAVALERLGKLVEASELLRVVAREAPERDPARRPSRELLAIIEPRIGRLVVYVDEDLGSAEVRLDGRPFAAARLGVATPVDPGVHVITVRRGSSEESREVDVAEGAEARVQAPVPASPSPAAHVALAPDRRSDFVTPPPTEEPRDGDEPHRISWPLILGGVGLVGAGVVVDVVPASGRNGELDALDLVPLALYGGGAILAALGVF